MIEAIVKFIGVNLFSYIINLIIFMGLFRKTGTESYKAFIPYYRIWIFYKLIDLSKLWFGFYILTCALGYFISFINLFNIKSLGVSIFVIAFISLVINIILRVLVSDQLGNSLGKTRGFKVGYFFLSYIFGLIAAFDKSKYLGPNGK